jgi:hypothetical protein
MKSRVYTDICGRPYLFYDRLLIVLNYIILVKNILGVFFSVFGYKSKVRIRRDIAYVMTTC